MADAASDITHSSYEQDFHAWVERQSKLLHEGRLDELDAKNLADEIEALAREIDDEVRDRFASLFQHLLQWQYQGGLRGRAWEYTIAEQRRSLRKLFAESPSLNQQRDQAMFDAYQDALRRTELESGYPSDVFPSSSPFTFEQTMGEDFWPELD